MTYRRHLSELIGKQDPQSGLTVRAMPMFDFEYQVSQHMKARRQRWPDYDENSLRQRLATGQAWLWPEPQMWLDFGKQIDR